MLRLPSGLPMCLLHIPVHTGTHSKNWRKHIKIEINKDQIFKIVEQYRQKKYKEKRMWGQQVPFRL